MEAVGQAERSGRLGAFYRPFLKERGDRPAPMACPFGFLWLPRMSGTGPDQKELEMDTVWSSVWPNTASLSLSDLFT